MFKWNKLFLISFAIFIQSCGTVPVPTDYPISTNYIHIHDNPQKGDYAIYVNAPCGSGRRDRFSWLYKVVKVEDLKITIKVRIKDNDKN